MIDFLETYEAGLGVAGCWTCRRQVQRLRKARRPVSWEKWVLSRPVAYRGKTSVGANEEGIHASL